MPEKKESARATVILALVAVAIAGYALLFGLQTLVYFEARHWAAAAPFLNDVPQPLPSIAVSAVQEKSLTFYGFQFAAPWKGIAKEEPGSSSSQIRFAPGPILIFFNPEGEKNIIDSIRSGNPQTYRQYQVIFGADIFPTNYALYSAVYGASPAAISPFLSRDQVIRESTLLQWKLAFGSNGAKVIYTIASGTKRGLQFGDPANEPTVEVRLFDEHDQQIRLLFTSPGAQRGVISQADINCVIDSLRPLSPEE